MDNKIWHRTHLKEIKQKAGPRYTSELNVDLPISEIFDGISRTEEFYFRIRKQHGKLLKEVNYIASKYKNDEIQKNYDLVRTRLKSLSEILSGVKKYNTKVIPWNKISEASESFLEASWELVRELRKAAEDKEQIKKDEEAEPVIANGHRPSLESKYNSCINHSYAAQSIVNNLKELASSSQASLSNNQFLLLTGSAGNGKTHLFCDLVARRVSNENKILPTILVFGENFSDKGDVWLQIIEQLGLSNTFSNKDHFLQKLNELGKKSESRSLLIVDALNETKTHDFWQKNISSIISAVKKYPHVALAVSIRSGFENQVLNEEQKLLFISEEHRGLHFKEWEAVNKFFTAFSIPLPEIPLLTPEFTNPLFLLLFCEAFGDKKRDFNNPLQGQLKNKTVNEIKKKKPFRGQVGLTHIFESFVKEAADKVAAKLGLKTGRNTKGQYFVWDTVIEKIAEEMAKKNQDRIPEDDLVRIIQESHPEINDIPAFIIQLEKSMLITRVPDYENKGKFNVRFPFQKFSDHIIARYIFKQYRAQFDKSNKGRNRTEIINQARSFFSKSTDLGKFISTSWNHGIIEALSIECPEQLQQIEFIEAAPYLVTDDYLRSTAVDAFISSIIWRNPKDFSFEKVRKIINKYIRTESEHHKLLNAFLSVSPIKDHPFNARFLHRYLSKLTMPQRDSWWLSFLHYGHGEHEAVSRLLDWSWSPHNKSNINEDSVVLVSIALSWFLTSSNKLVRGKATKGLVSILDNRIELISEILEEFKEVNDPYVAERLYAVAYGCALRNTSNKAGLKKLAEWVYKNIFESNRPPVHILLRDYARGIIEVALKHDTCPKNILEKKVNPPYKSKWPEIPTQQFLEKEFNLKDDNSKFSNLQFSITGYGDFDKHMQISAWSSRKLYRGEPDREKLFEKFKESLSQEQKELLGTAINSMFWNLSLVDDMPKIKINFVGVKDEKHLKTLQIAENKRKKARITKQKKFLVTFKQSLSPTKKNHFENEIEPFLDDRGHLIDPLKSFDKETAKRWIFNRVIELGYDPDLHGEFDKRVGRYYGSETENVSERIWEKYRLIAYHEFTALLSDHFAFNGNDWDKSKKQYKGPWHPHLRDVDPSFIVRNDDHLKELVTFSKWKSSGGRYRGWQKKKNNNEWMRNEKDLPNPANIISITDDNGKEWLVLESYMQWEDEIQPEIIDKYNVPVQQLWYMTKSYIVKNEDSKNLLSWMKKTNFYGRWMPESYSFYETFLGEYPDYSAFQDLRKEDYNVGVKPNESKIPMIVTDDSYSNSLDYSLNKGISISLPCKWIIDRMHLHQNFDGRFFDKEDNLIAFTTDIFEKKYPSALLIDKKSFSTFLNENNCSIFWTLIGEKLMIGGHSRNFGRLEINGSYILNKKSKIAGNYQAEFKNS